MISNKTKQDLISMGLRTLEKGEVFILSYAISLKLPLPEVNSDPHEIKMHCLSYRNNVDSVVYSLNDFMYIDENTRKEIYELIYSFVRWRRDIAFGNFIPLFKDTETILDDFTNITKYIDMTYVCSLKDIETRLNSFTRTMFDLVEETYE